MIANDMKLITDPIRSFLVTGKFAYYKTYLGLNVLLYSGAAFSRRDLYVRHQKTACSGLNLGFGRGYTRKTGKSARSTTQYLDRRGTPEGDDVNDPDYIPTGSGRPWMAPELLACT